MLARGSDKSSEPGIRRSAWLFSDVPIHGVQEVSTHADSTASVVKYGLGMHWSLR